MRIWLFFFSILCVLPSLRRNPCLLPKLVSGGTSTWWCFVVLLTSRTSCRTGCKLPIILVHTVSSGLGSRCAVRGWTLSVLFCFLNCHGSTRSRRIRCYGLRSLTVWDHLICVCCVDRWSLVYFYVFSFWRLLSWVWLLRRWRSRLNRSRRGWHLYHLLLSLRVPIFCADLSHSSKFLIVCVWGCCVCGVAVDLFNFPPCLLSFVINIYKLSAKYNLNQHQLFTIFVGFWIAHE